MKRLYVTKAEVSDDLTVKVVFSDNTSQTVDVGGYIRRHPHPQYNKYLDPKRFRRFAIEHGNVVWGRNWDLVFPVEQLYAGTLL